MDNQFNFNPDLFPQEPAPAKDFAPQEPVAPMEEPVSAESTVSAEKPVAPAMAENPVDGGSYHYAKLTQDIPDMPRREAPQTQTSYFTPAPGFTPEPDPRYYTAANMRNPAPKPAKKKKGIRWTGGKVVALALVCAFIGGGMGFGGSLLANKLTAQDTPAASNNGTTSTILEGTRENVTLDVSHIETGKLQTPREVYAANVNSTVGITTSINGTNFWGYPTTSAAAGSGFIITEDGYILTNYHVIENSSTITVATFDGTTYEATLVGFDESNDIAVLKIDAKGLVPVVLGDSDNLYVGDSVIAIGNPLGELTFSLTSGAVSALDREVTLSNNLVMNLIQTDCAINSGNSGGPLFNLYGEVIGITNAKYSSSSYSGEASIDNIGFAIPINSVRDIVDSIIEKGFVSKPYIGVSVTNVSEEAQGYGAPAGAAVQGLVENGPAAQAGLQVNDIITKVNDTVITSSNDLVSCIGDYQVGDKLNLTVVRQNKTISIQITVGEQIKSASEQANSQQQQQQQQQQEQQQETQPQNGYGYDYGNGNGFGSFPWGWFFGG